MVNIAIFNVGYKLLSKDYGFNFPRARLDSIEKRLDLLEGFNDHR